MSTSDVVQLVGAIGSLVCLIGTAIWWCLQRHLKKLYLLIKALEQKNAHLADSCHGLQTDKARLDTENSHLNQDVRRLHDEGEDARRQLRQAAQTLSEFRTENAELRVQRNLWQIHQGDLQRVQQERDQFRSEAEQLKGQLAAVRTDLAGVKGQLERTEEQRRRATEHAEEVEQQLHRRIDEYQAAVEKRDGQIAHISGERDSERDRADRAEASANQMNEQIDQVIKQDERVWERSVTCTPFQPLSLRHVPIIAVLNLKGGVGKTTITANLAGVMARQGKKVLAIDADYQRNLSMLFLSDKDRKMLHLERRTLQHFLSGSNRDLPSLLHVAGQVPDFSNCWVVTNSDALRPPTAAPALALEDSSLEDVEMRLMAEWMFRPNGPDARLALREALHDFQLQQRGYRYVLIDCPPRLSTACINALAASDLVLVPVLLDATSARSVPNLLRTLVRLRSEKLFPHLRCLGVVANKVHLRAGEPIAQQARIWKQLLAPCRVAWGSVVHLFKTHIPQSTTFADSAGSLLPEQKESWPRLAIRDDKIHQVFTDLLTELEARIEDESKIPADVPGQPAVSHLGG